MQGGHPRFRKLTSLPQYAPINQFNELADYHTPSSEIVRMGTFVTVHVETVCAARMRNYNAFQLEHFHQNALKW